MITESALDRAVHADPSHQPATPAAHPVRWAILLGVGYYLGTWLGFQLTLESRAVSMLWFPNALMLGALVFVPVRAWWIMLAGAFVAHLAGELTAGVPLTMVLSWFASNSIEALIGAGLILRYGSRPFQLDRSRNVVVFVLAAVLAILLSTVLDAALVLLNGWGSSSFWTVARVRFFSNVLATLAIVPVMLGVAGLRVSAFRHVPVSRWVEGSLLTVGLFAVSYLVFGRQHTGPITTPVLPYLFLLWAAVRFGPAASGIAIFTIVMIAIWNAVHGRGPFASLSPEISALEIQLLFTTASITLISLAAVLEERRRAEASAWRRGEQLRMALEAAQLTTWDWMIPDESTSRTPAVPAATSGERSGVLPVERLLGRIHPADRAMVARSFARALNDGHPLNIHFRVAQPEGDVRWMHGRGTVVRDERGRPVRVIGMSADVTERRMAEALNSGESRILEMIATGAPLRDVLTRLVHLIESESLGLICSIMLLDDDGVHVRTGAAPNLPEDYIRAIDGVAIGPNAGSCGTAMCLRQPVLSLDIRTDPRWADYRDAALRHGLLGCWSTPIISNRSEVLGSFAAYYRYPREPSPREVQLVDVATQLAAIALERRRVENELADQHRALAHLGRASVLGELSGALAHELSQPLAAILSDAQTARRMLAADTHDVAQVREILDDIVASDRRAADVIDRLRTLLLKRSPQVSPLSLNEIVADTLKLVRVDLTARHVIVHTHLMPGLPAILGDRVQLQQVILNLCLNAFDAVSANPPIERILTITTRVSTDGEFVELDFGDSGPGVPDGQIERIFEPFFTSKDHGLGLGLSISRSIVFQHMGTLSATNSADGGATFRLELPVADTARAAIVARNTSAATNV